MKNLFFIFLGGGTGSLLRHLVSLASLYFFKNYGALVSLGIVNILGGIGAGYVSMKYLGDHSLKHLILVGFLGGFTTFSSFSLESMRLFQKGEFILALFFIFLVLVGSILGVFLGQKI